MILDRIYVGRQIIFRKQKMLFADYVTEGNMRVLIDHLYYCGMKFQCGSTVKKFRK